MRKIKIIQKAGQQLTSGELAEMNAIVHFHDPSLPLTWVQHHLKEGESDFMLVSDGGKVMGFSNFKTVYCITPFHKKEIPVIYSGISYKSADLKMGSMIRKLSTKYVVNQLGALWFLRPIVTTTSTVNPKVLRLYVDFYYLYYPNYVQEISTETLAFVRWLYRDKIGHNWSINEKLIAIPNHTHFEELEITDRWKAHYDCGLDYIQNYVEENDVHVVNGDRRYLRDRSVVALGYHHPWLRLKKLLSLKKTT